jgi:myo-inositol 2-dehydrogenase / D-chiro-inositol 1-dehydrogenase
MKELRMKRQPDYSRRQFLGGALAASAAGTLLGALRTGAEEPAATPAAPANSPPVRKIKIGLVGCGGRGHWIMPLFKAHGGYECHAVADYFQPVAEAMGTALGVDPSRRFSGLSGYKKLIESGVEAVVIEDVPCFYPEQALAAVEAGKHVYMAKPVAVDVPGTLQIGEAGKKATQKNLCFVVDYQLPTEPASIEAADRLRAGAVGALAHVVSYGMAWHAWPDPAKGPNIESRLQNEIWLSDTNLSGDTIVSYDIHIIDTLIWALGRRPVAAYGGSRTLRANPQGDRTDVAAVIYEFEDGLMWTHVTQALDNNYDALTLSATILGTTAEAFFHYGGKVFVRGGDRHFSGSTPSVFQDGVVRNIANFHSSIAGGRFENPTVQRAVDGHLTAILGREAAARHSKMTMDELLKENKALAVDLTGLSA